MNVTPPRTHRTPLTLSVAAAALCLAGSAFADAAADRIRATPDGGGSDWDAKVKLILLANYDLNGSGWIDKIPEMDSIPCSTWKALDDGVLQKWDYGLRTIYGFEPDKFWVGSAIGIDESMRAHGDSILGGCSARGWADGGGTAGGVASTGPVHQQIRNRSEVGGSDEWDAAVKPILVRAFDKNSSGWIDTTDELMGMDCEVIKALDDGVRQKWEYGLRIIYGFQADKIWIGGALGFGEVIRSGADVRIAGCLDGGGTARSTPSAGRTPPTTSGGGGAGLSATIRGIPGGGSGEWDTKVSKVLLGAYDANSSGWLDTTGEVDKLSCDEWKALDDGVRQKWDYGIRIIYGFQADKIWVGDALKFAEPMRGHADGKLVGCGLLGGASPAGSSGPAAEIRAFPGGGSSAWDDKVKAVMVRAFDKDGSGWIDTAAEVSAIGCDVWGAMDAGVKQSYTYGLRPIYGFEPGYNWIGYAVGFSESVRTQGDAALVSCGHPQ